MELLRGDVIIEIVALVGTAISVYAAIRSDLASIHEKNRIYDEKHKEHADRIEKVDDKLTTHVTNFDLHSLHRRRDDA